MLKSCWDCIGLGDSRQQTDEVVYGTQLNGDSKRAPPWPEPVNQNEIMFLLPRRLQVNDKIHIEGVLSSNPRSFTIMLVTGDTPDYSNIAFYFEASIQDDLFITKIIHQGQESSFPVDMTPSELIGGTDFTASIIIRISNYVENPVIDISLGVSPVTQVELKHKLQDIRYLVLNGDVQKVDKLNFEFS